jgi:hypothetical protein
VPLDDIGIGLAFIICDRGAVCTVIAPSMPLRTGGGADFTPLAMLLPPLRIRFTLLR